MGMMEDFESSLQVLRGFDADISVEVNEVKVIIPKNFKPVSVGDNKMVYLSISVFFASCREL